MILFMHRPMTVKRAVAICTCLILGLLSKEQGMLLPFLLLLLGSPSRDLRRRCQELFSSGRRLHPAGLACRA